MAAKQQQQKGFGVVFISQQGQLAITHELMHIYPCQVTFLGLANRRVSHNVGYDIIHIGFLSRMQAFAGLFKHRALLNLEGITHQLRFPSGTNGVASVGAFGASNQQVAHKINGEIRVVQGSSSHQSSKFYLPGYGKPLGLRLRPCLFVQSIIYAYWHSHGFTPKLSATKVV
jgi:hypothetical protein